MLSERLLVFFALTLITQLFDPSCHCGKANIHSFGGICHRVFLVNNQLSGFAFKLCAKISFSLEHLCCSEVSISPLFRCKFSVPLQAGSGVSQSPFTRAFSEKPHPNVFSTTPAGQRDLYPRSDIQDVSWRTLYRQNQCGTIGKCRTIGRGP